jgi:hypothetical protein
MPATLDIAPQMTFVASQFMKLPTPTRRLALLMPFACTMASCIVSAAQAADAACVYQSRAYSEGAFICVQRSLMQACTSDGARLVWRIVADKDIADRCLSPLASAQPRKRMIHRTRIARQVAAPAQPNSAKCFVFNGKRYCE